MSAPASAWLTATRPRISSVASLSTRAVAQHAAVAVAGVLAAADVGDQQQIGIALPQPPQRLLDDAVLREILRADLVLRGRQAEEQHRGDAERLDPVHLPIEHSSTER